MAFGAPTIPFPFFHSVRFLLNLALSCGYLYWLNVQPGRSQLKNKRLLYGRLFLPLPRLMLLKFCHHLHCLAKNASINAVTNISLTWSFELFFFVVFSFHRNLRKTPDASVFSDIAWSRCVSSLRNDISKAFVSLWNDVTAGIRCCAFRLIPFQLPLSSRKRTLAYFSRSDNLTIDASWFNFWQVGQGRHNHHCNHAQHFLFSERRVYCWFPLAW